MPTWSRSIEAIARSEAEHLMAQHGGKALEIARLEALRARDQAVGAETAYIEPGSPWENGYCESLNGKRPLKASY